MSLDALTALAKRELEQLRYPAPNWVPPREGVVDVLVVGGGMCGQTATFALLREGVTNLRCLDRAPRAREGPWRSCARARGGVVGGARASRRLNASHRWRAC